MADTLNDQSPDGAERPRSRGPASQLPDPRRILGGVFVGRLAFAGITFLLVLASSSGASDLTLAATLLLLTLAFTGATYSYTHRSTRRIRNSFVYGQLIFDALLVTAGIHLTGGEQSMLAPLFILVIFAAALLLPFAGAIIIGLLVSVLYLAKAVWWGPGTPDTAVLFQVALFAVVAFVTAYLGDRLRQAGEALGEVQTELRLLRLDTGEILDSIGTGIITVDGSGRLVYINPAAAEILSLPAARWTGKPILEALDRAAPGLGTVIAHSAEAATPIRRYETEPLADDSFILGVSTTLMERPDGERPPITAIFQDITEKKRMEALRRRAERLEAVAELSASLAHEIKNPLASIRSAVEQITSGAIDADDSKLLRSLVIRESDRLSRLLTEFIDFARVKVTAPQPVDLAAVVQHVAQLVRTHPDAEDRSLDVSIAGPPDAMWTRGGEDLLHRAVLNLALNAVQWAGPGGRVELTLDEVRTDLLSPALGALSLIRLTVADSGPGVDDEIAESIFDPFFTRRPGGTGLGLALVQRAVEAHGGAIFVDSSPAPSAPGAMFTLYLPALPTEPALATFTSAEEATSL